MLLTLRQIEFFVTVGQFESVSKAADKLCVTQAAVSMAINEIENILEKKLFDRVGRRIVLNEYGRDLFPKAVSILNRLSEFENYLINEDNLKGKLIIGATRTVGNYILPLYLKTFIKNYPEIKIELIINNTYHITRLVENYELDVALIEGYCNSIKVKKTFWKKDRMFIFSSPKNSLCEKKVVTPNELENEKWVLREKGSGTREIFERAVLNKINYLNIVAEIGSLEAIKETVEDTEFISCMSIEAIKKEINNKTLEILNTPWLSINRDLHILTNKVKNRTRLLNTFISFIMGLDLAKV
ncbi:MAG: LysR substrate-binding domain-containing protein [Deferribacterota bacterium]|nr:LysR substrate-binding domain-containing protein [Deferribacterota bacterium]